MKKTRSQNNRLQLQEVTDLFMTRNKIIKNSKYYNRLYSTKPNSINMSSSLSKDITNNLFLSSPNNNITNINNNININNKSKFNIPKKRIFSSKKKMLWPKVTKPKWPFSLNRNEPKELVKKRLSSAKPSGKYHTFSTIRWLNQKYTDSVKQKSILSLLPNKGKVIIPQDENEKNKRHRKIVEYLETFRAPKEREKNVEINPKYFYNNRTFEKINKMKEIFLMFDKEGKQKLALKEMAKLYKNNDIDVTINELKDLFYKDIKNKNIKNLSINLLYINFYQFMKFSLSSDQDFREFIRKIRKKKKNKQEKKDTYFPMNFNAALEYFIRKEKQKNSINAVQNAIKDIDKMIRIENDDTIEKSNILNDEFSMSRKSNNAFILSSKSNNKIIAKSNNSYLENNNVKDIDFSQLIDDFSNLFGIKNAKKELDEEIMKKKREAKSAKIRKYKTKDKNITFTEDIKTKLRNETLKNLNVENYIKYNSLKLAIEATKEQVKFMKKHNKKNGLIEEDKQTVDMVDIRDVINQDNFAHTPSKIFHFRKSNALENINNSFLFNVYLDFRTKNRRRHLKEKYDKALNEFNEKPIFNYYCGSPIIINNELKTKSKYDFVPNELFK